MVSIAATKMWVMSLLERSEVQIFFRFLAVHNAAIFRYYTMEAVLWNIAMT